MRKKGRAHVCTKLQKRNNHEILVKGSIYLVIGPQEYNPPPDRQATQFPQ